MRILIIDDDPGTCETLSYGLRKSAGHCVATAFTGLAGLAFAAAESYDAALVDLRLPDISGLDVLSGLKKTQSSVAAVYMFSAFASVEAVVAAMRSGATGFMEKPVELETVLNLFSQQEPSAICSAAPIDPRIQIVLTAIAENPAIASATLSTLTNLGPSRLRHLFRKAIGVSFGRFQRDARLDRAALLLRTSPKRISEIAFEVGFAEVNHFDRTFHSRYGVTPTAYRVANSANK